MQLVACLVLPVQLARQGLKLLMISLVSRVSLAITAKMTNLRNSALWATIALLIQINLLFVL